MLLHVIDSVDNHTRIIVRCDETDVLVLLLYYCGRGDIPINTCMHAGHEGALTNSQKFIPINEVTSTLGAALTQCLPTIHVLTGCDSISSLFRIGKRTAFKNPTKEHA